MYKLSGMGSAEYSLGFCLWLVGTAWILTSLITIFVTRDVKDKIKERIEKHE